MKLCPTDLEELKRQMGDLRRKGCKITEVDLGAMDRVIAHEPDDMTMTVEAGITVGQLQDRAGRAGQWLPMDPPHARRCSVGAMIAGNLSGSRRYGYGTVREHLIGLGVVLADGRLIRSGGRVVKNVAGYDLQKLFVGSGGSLGVIVEATFKLLPVPEAEQWVQARCSSLAEAGALLERVVEARLAPVLLDLHNLGEGGPAEAISLVLAFAGMRESVDHELEQARRFGVGSPVAENAQELFWSDLASVQSLSVLPSRTVEALGGMGDARWLAHAGNGVIHHRGGPVVARPELPWVLLQRIKKAFDPEGLFPELNESELR